MTKPHRLRRAFAPLLLAALMPQLLGGCAAPTVLNTQWLNPQAAGKPPIRSVLVMGILKDPSNRRNFEDQMVAELAARGVKAVPSYRYAPDAAAAEQVKLEQAVRESGAAAVLLSRVVNVTEQVNVSPGMVVGPPMGPPMGYGFGGFYGFYGGMWATSYYVPPTVYTTQHIAADTRLFETVNYSVLWTASTTTTPSGGSIGSVLQQFSQLIVGALAKDGLI